MTATIDLPVAPHPHVRPGRTARLARTWVWECRELAAQLTVQGVTVLCLVAPVLLVAVLKAESSTPSDTLFGRWVHDSGSAPPLVLLSFAGQWVFPALVAVVAGDIFSSADRHGTWRTLLTRSRTWPELFAAKVLAVLAYSLVIVVLLTASAVLSGLIFLGHPTIVGLSGQLVTGGHATGLVLASWATVVLPTLGFAAIGVLLSVLTRSSVVGVAGPVVLGLLMQLLSLANGISGLRAVLLSAPYTAWHGLWADPSFSGPTVAGQLVGLVWIVVPLVAAYLVGRRRDVRGG